VSGPHGRLKLSLPDEALVALQRTPDEMAA